MARGKAQRPKRRTPGIRTQLLLFLCFICLILLMLFWFLSTNLLQPMYNRLIETKLTAQADSLVQLVDQNIANGTLPSTRSFGTLVVSEEFKQQLYDNLEDNVAGLANFCVDISDTTLRNVVTVENLYPCLLHNSTLSDGGLETQDPSTALNLRQLCRVNNGMVSYLTAKGGSSQIVIGRVTSGGEYTILVVASLVHVTEAVQVLRDLLPFVGLLVFVLAFFASWIFSRWFTKPLVQLSGAAQQMARGNYDVQLDIRRKDELGTLAQDFDHMASEVKRSLQLQRDLLANVSHDLRTPLTLIKGYAETVRDLTGDDKTRRDEQMNIIVDETDRLSALVNSVMELSKVTSGTEKCERVRFDMAQLCEEVSERYEGICAQNGWQLILDVDEYQTLSVWADPAMMERALHNLLGNAMHHIGADGIFILRAKRCDGGCRVEIEDHGEGIKAEDLPYIFDRYYRSRSDAGKVGTGLGLSITKAIFQQHGFRFGVESTVGKGTIFWFIMTDMPKPPKEQRTQEAAN
jgi:signal transduction histidine kinase